MLDRLNSLKGKVLADDMTRHGTMMVFFVLLGTVFNFLFMLVIMRMLSPADYGTFLALISLLLIVGVFCGPIDTSVAKFVSKEWVHRRLGRINYLWGFFLKRTFLLGVGLFPLGCLHPLDFKVLQSRKQLVSHYLVLLSNTCLCYSGQLGSHARLTEVFAFRRQRRAMELLEISFRGGVGLLIRFGAQW